MSKLDADYRFARIAYEGYCRQTGWKSLVTGQDLPGFDKLPEDIKLAWKSAAWHLQMEFCAEGENDVRDFIEEEMCVHEGGIEGGVSFSYDDATFNWCVRVGSERKNTVKWGYGRWLTEAISKFRKEHRQVFMKK